jgi:hypothetical protein
MDDPLTRFAVSTIPAGDNHDALRMLLKAAFEAGAELRRRADRCRTR